MERKHTRATCKECYFRQASLCALSPDEACPTFRHHARGPLVAQAVPEAPRRHLAAVLAERRFVPTAAA